MQDDSFHDPEPRQLRDLATGSDGDFGTGLSRDPGTGHPRPPRREFKARGSFVERCPGCNLPQLNCLCPYAVGAESEARVWLLTHSMEHLKPTNTGRLIRDVLPDTEVFTWYRTAPDERLLALLEDERFTPFVVFPDDQPDYAERVVGIDAVAEAKAAGRIPVYLLLDGTWRQARRIFRKSPYLDALPVLPLRTERLTRYRLRKPAPAPTCAPPRWPPSCCARAAMRMPPRPWTTTSMPSTTATPPAGASRRSRRRRRRCDACWRGKGSAVTQSEGRLSPDQPRAMEAESTVKASRRTACRRCGSRRSRCRRRSPGWPSGTPAGCETPGCATTP